MPPEGEFERSSEGLELVGAAATAVIAIGWATTVVVTRAECAIEEASSSILFTCSEIFS